jgi:hypothetical protein
MNPAWANGAARRLRRFATALVPLGLVLGACAATPTAECAQAQKDFETAAPSSGSFTLAAGDVVPALVAGVALAVVERMPDAGRRERCYNEIMHARFASYPAYATVR